MLPRKNSHHNVVLELVEQNKFKIIAEIGVWRSNMSKYILLRYKDLEQYWAIDPWAPFEKGHGRVSKVPQEAWDHAYLKSCSIMRYFSAFRSIRLPSLVATNIFPPNYFDLVYIDALHDYTSVRNDILAWKPKIRSNGILAGHDWKSGAHKGHRVADAVLSVFDEKELTILPRQVWSVRL